MTKNPAVHRLRTRAVLAAGATTFAAAGLTTGLVIGVSGSSEASGTTSTGTAGTSGGSSSGTGTSDTGSSNTGSSNTGSSNTGSSNTGTPDFGPADQQGSAHGGSNGS